MKDKEVFDLYSRSFWDPLIDEWIHSEKDRQMIRRKFLDGLTFEELAEEFEMSVNHCQKRVKKAKNQLFKHIKII